MVAGEFAHVLHLAETLWFESPTLTTAGFLSAALKPIADKCAFPVRRVDVFRSYTLESVVPLIAVQGLMSRQVLDIRLGQYNAYIQDLMNAAPGADVALVALHTRIAAPALWRGGDADTIRRDADWLCDSLSRALEVYRAAVPAPIAMQLLDYPPGAENARVKWVDDVNDRLSAITRQIPDCHAFHVADPAGRNHGCWHEERNWAIAKIPFRNDCAGDVATRLFQQVRPALGSPLKALVVDLDNTLWGGVLGEDGEDGLRMAAGTSFRRLQETLLSLKDRGILLGIASKNDEASALSVLSGHPDCLLRPEHFASLRINWQSKSVNIRAIGEDLNIGLDAIAFLDDNPIERVEVARNLPMVRVLPHFADARTADMLAAHPEFQRFKVAAEDASRTALYAARKALKNAEVQADSREAFLASLRQEVMLETLTDETFARAADLERKTNQFNVRTRRFGEVELRNLALGPDSYVLAFRVLDRFGDNGIVGLVSVSIDGVSAVIESFLMSCRVIGRGVEFEMMRAVAAEACVRGCVDIVGTFAPTAKNGPSKDFFREAGFAYERNEDDVAFWRRSVSVLIGDQG